MSVKILTAAINGLTAEIVKVEADNASGEFGQIAIVGLPDAAVSEARERVKSALKNCPLSYPKRKITVNLAPAHFKKQGSGYDLPIALCILALSNNFEFNFQEALFVGELSLDGEIRPLRSILPLIIAAKKRGLQAAFIPIGNAAEASLIPDIEIYPIKSLKQLLSALKNKQTLPLYSNNHYDQIDKKYNPWSKIKGQETAKRALTICAAGRHNLIMSGPPGSGKSLLAQSLSEIMPDLNQKEQLAVAQIHSVAGDFLKIANKLKRPPFRAPHHSASSVSILGGGRGPKPGEITLAHHGILFLDELPEFPRKILDSLRQPLEQRKILISRADQHVFYPADFLFIAAMNPCPCGYYGDDQINCNCPEKLIANYQQKISGPIWDRFDLQVQINRLTLKELSQHETSKSPPLKTIYLARKKQIQRQKTSNAAVNDNYLNIWQKNSPEAEKLALKAAEGLSLSARAYQKIFRVARTIADLEDEENINPEHIAEALSYRRQR